MANKKDKGLNNDLQNAMQKTLKDRIKKRSNSAVSNCETISIVLTDWHDKHVAINK